MRHPVLYLLVCGARATDGLEPFVKTCQKQGWDVWVFATPDGAASIDSDVLEELTAHPVLVDDPPADEPGGPPRPGALAVLPASFDAMVDLAYARSDSLALRMVTEAIGYGLPILAMPAPEPALAGHPVFAESVERLRTWGVSVLFHRGPIPSAAGDADDPGEHLPWHAAEDKLGEWIRFARVPAPGRAD